MFRHEINLIPNKLNDILRRWVRKSLELTMWETICVVFDFANFSPHAIYDSSGDFLDAL